MNWCSLSFCIPPSQGLQLNLHKFQTDCLIFYLKPSANRRVFTHIVNYLSH